MHLPAVALLPTSHVVGDGEGNASDGDSNDIHLSFDVV